MRSLLPWIQPLSLVWLLLTVGFAASLWRKRWQTSAGLFVAWTLLTLLTCMPVPSALLASLERRHPPAMPQDIAACEVLICLGGGVEPAPQEPSGIHLKRAADRLGATLTLARRHGIRHVVLGGGAYGSEPDWQSEAGAIAQLLMETDLGDLEIHSLGICEHTRHEAEKVAALMAEKDWKEAGLVTSANHMPRAHATFQKAGVATLAIPCNYLSSHMRLGPLQWFHAPGPEGLSIFNDWMHEVLGTWYYRYKGWL